jgi:hypothetical protein
MRMVFARCFMKKYLKNKRISQVVRRPRDSYFWAGLMDVKDMFFEKGDSRSIVEPKQDFRKTFGLSKNL